MAEMVISSGIPDNALYLQAAANVAAPFKVESSSGNYPLVGNVLAQRRLANQWIMVNLTNRAFVDGMGVTSVGAESENVGFIRFPLLYMPPRLKRTLGTSLNASDTGNGTPGNSAPFNKNLPHGVQTDGFDLKFIQEYDEAAQISRVNMRMIGSSLDLMGQYTQYIPMAVGLLMDADVMATHIGAGLSFASKHNNSNVIAYNPATTDKGYLQKLMNGLKSKLSNVRGEYKAGVISYPRNKSVYVMRQTFFDSLMTIDNGAIINSDVGQKILLNGYLDETGSTLVGNYIEGKYSGIYIKVIPDEYWDTAAAELNLDSDAYAQFNKVVCYIANAEGTYFGMSSTVTDIDKSPTTSIGFIIRNDWGWGVKNVRPSSIAFIVESASDLTDFTNPVPDFTDITSPANVEEMIAAYQDGSVSEKALQRIGVTNSDTVCAVALTVTGTSSAKVSNANVAVRREDGTYATVSNEGEGVYKFNVERGTTATVAIAATGYKNATVKLSATDTAGLTATKTQALTAE